MIPLTPNNIDRIMDVIFREFNHFSDDISHAKIKELTPPFLDYLNGTKDIIQYLNIIFERYYSELSKIRQIDLVDGGLHEIVAHHSKLNINFNLLRDIKILEDAIIQSLNAYYEGLPSKAFQILRKISGKDE